VGLSANLFNYAVYALSAYANESIVFSALLGYFAGLVLSFFMGRLWVFKETINRNFVLSTSKQTVGFILIHALSALSMGVLTNALVQYISLEISIAFLASAVPIALFNYLSLNFLVFQTKKTKVETS
jgi:putative flippase GtrA